MRLMGEMNMWKSKRCLKLCNVCSVFGRLGESRGVGTAPNQSALTCRIMYIKKIKKMLANDHLG